MLESIDTSLSTVDIALIVIYFIFVVALGVYFSKKTKNEAEYFLAGRNLAWPVIGFSLFASNMGSNSLIGLAGSGYNVGFQVFSYEWMAAVVLVIFAVFFLPFYLKNRIFTIPEMLEKRYNAASRYYFSTITICLNVFIDIAATLYAGALLINFIFPSLSMVLIIWIIAVFAAFYTVMGGLSSVVYTDFVQAVLLILGSVVITVMAWNKVGGWEAITDTVDKAHLTIIQPADSEALPWPALFTGVFILGFYFWVTNQFIVQRALASRNTQNGQWGAIFAGFLKLLALFIMILPGVIALVLYPNMENPDMVYPTLVFDLLPHGLLGLILAGFVAALMSSVDSALNSAATLFTFDFYKKARPDTSQQDVVKVARYATIAFTIIAALWAPQIAKFDTLWDYLQQILAFICPPIVAMVIIGLFTKKVNGNGAVATIITGVGLSLVSLGFSDAEWMPIYLYVAGINFVICSFVLVTVSALMPAKTEKDLSLLIWTPQTFRDETLALRGTPFYKNYRFLSLLLLAFIAVLLIVF